MLSWYDDGEPGFQENVGVWGSQVDGTWEMGTAGDSRVLPMPVGHWHWGAGNGLEDGSPHFTRSSEVLDEPH